MDNTVFPAKGLRQMAAIAAVAAVLGVELVLGSEHARVWAEARLACWEKALTMVCTRRDSNP